MLINLPKGSVFLKTIYHFVMYTVLSSLAACGCLGVAAAAAAAAGVFVCHA